MTTWGDHRLSVPFTFSSYVVRFALDMWRGLRYGACVEQENAE